MGRAFARDSSVQPMARPVELSADPRIARRVRRLGYVSAVALGLIWGLAVTTVHPPIAISAALAAGWALMPALLFGSLARPVLRYGLVVPATLVGGGLIGLIGLSPPPSLLAEFGWLLVTAGVVFGGFLGLWFWYRLLPVPRFLDDPEATGRWALIALHVGLIIVGWMIAATALL